MSGSEQQPPHDAEDGAFWMKPPPNPAADGEPIWVDIRLNLMKVSAVDTVAGTAFVDVYTIYYWTDPRLAGWQEGRELPARLWGPRLELQNALGDLQEEDLSFLLVNLATGRVKRIRQYSGTVDNPMDLRSFPFDMDKIELDFRTYSGYSTYDGKRSGQMAKGKSYRLRQIREPGEGKWLDLLWSGQIGEWTLHGVSTSITEEPPAAAGFERIVLPLSLHVTRNSAYYFWKALLPLYMLTALSMSTFHFETDNLDSRVATVSTYLLAAFAMLYVLGAALPKTDFLTKIDTVIVMTTVSLAFTGIASLALAKMNKEMGVVVADDWNLATEVSLISLYVLCNFWIFAPPCIRQLRGAGRLDGYKRLAPTDISVGAAASDAAADGAGADLPPTVEPGCDYYTLEDVKNGRV
jgi:hypothetical protein